MNICGVVFDSTNKVYYFDADKVKVKKGDTVIVETEKGLQFGKVMEVNVKLSNEEIINNIKPLLRKSTKEDYNNYLTNLKDAKKALTIAKKQAEKLGLEMNIINAFFTFDRKQLTFNFIADERIDFRELVKFLAATYKTRIELHQMGVRDKAKMVGGVGSCGRALCCNTFLNKLDTISINMAKNQNIALNPTKINGACGRLLCCLQYEDDNYTFMKKDFPAIGDIVKTEFGKGEVIELNILKGTYTVLINEEKKEINVNENAKK